MIVYILLCLVLGACLALFIWARWIERRMLRVTHLRFLLPKLDPGLIDKKIVAFSDLHLDGDDPADTLTRLQEKVNAENPDVICFLGDMFDSYPAWEEYYRANHPASEAPLWQEILPQKAEKKDDVPEAMQPVLECFSGMKPGALRVAVLGNHDHEESACPAIRQTLEKAGFTLLEGEALLKDGIGVGGMEDFIQGSADPEPPRIGGGFRVLLCHEPDAVLLFERGGFDLLLSGHTHGGQVSLPLVNRLYRPWHERKFRAGVYRLDEHSKLLVTRGIGCSLLPLRLGSCPEILSIRLDEGDEAKLLWDEA